MLFSKRSRIIASNLITAFLLFSLTFINFKWQYFYLIFIVIGSYILISWSFKQYLYGIKLINLFVLPVLLVTFIGILIIQIDFSFWLKSALIAVFLVINYIIILSENIFNVSEVRNIPLLRAAHTVGYLATLGVAYLGFFLIYFSKINMPLTLIFLGVFSFLIYLQAFWQIELKEDLSTEVFLSSVASTLMTTQLGFIICLWPLTPIGAAMSLTTSVYTFLGLIQYRIKNNLSKRAGFEYITVGLFVFLLILFTQR